MVLTVIMGSYLAVGELLCRGWICVRYGDKYGLGAQVVNTDVTGFGVQAGDHTRNDGN